MAWTIEKLIKNPVKYPVRRVYIKRRSVAGVYESVWQRIDVRDGVNKIISHGSVEIKIDSDKITPNNYEISDYSTKIMNQDGEFNSASDYRSCWYGYSDHKDTRIKIVVGMKDPDKIELGTITAFEGLIQSIVSKGDNTADIKAAQYSKKLNEYPFKDLSLSGNKTVTQILTAIFADVRVASFFDTTTLTPVNNVTIDLDTDTDNNFEGTIWDVLKFLAEKSQSTIYAFNTEFYFGTREIADSTPVFTYAGLGNSQDDRAITIYGKPDYDQSGSDKLYTTIIDSSSNSIAKTTDPILLNTGKTLTLDLKDLATVGEKQDVCDSYLARYGVRRPSVKFKSPFMMMIVMPLDPIAIDSPGSKTEINSAYYDSSLYDDGSVYDGDGTASNIDKDDRFVVESIKYNIQKWECDNFCRKLV